MAEMNETKDIIHSARRLCGGGDASAPQLLTTPAGGPKQNHQMRGITVAAAAKSGAEFSNTRMS
jgi:hypothetical protein